MTLTISVKVFHRVQIIQVCYSFRFDAAFRDLSLDRFVEALKGPGLLARGRKYRRQIIRVGPIGTWLATNKMFAA